MKAVILAAGVGKRLRPFHDLPKCLLSVGGSTPLLGRYLEGLVANGADEAVIVVGYRRQAIADYLTSARPSLPVRLIENPDFERGSVLSLWRAREALEGDCLLMDADVYFEPAVLERLCGSASENALLLDSTRGFTGEEVLAGARNGRVVDMARGLQGDYEVLGEWVGFARVGDAASRLLSQRADEAVRHGNADGAYEDLVATLFSDIHFGYELADGLRWLEIDFGDDLEEARRLDGAG